MRTAPQDFINTKALKFNLWLTILSIVMLFAGWTSAYLVRKAQGNWLVFDMPDFMTYSTFVIGISSITLYISYHFAVKNNIAAQKLWLSITTLLGIAFVAMQFLAFKELASKGIFLDSNPSSSFLIVIAMFHAFHIVAGVGALIYAFFGASGKLSSTRNVFRMELVSIFWHFVDILWIYLFVFLLLYR